MLDPDPYLRERARAAMSSGTLPRRAPNRTFGGRGSGETCAICGDRIRLNQVGFEIVFVHDAGSEESRFTFIFDVWWPGNSSAGMSKVDCLIATPE